MHHGAQFRMYRRMIAACLVAGVASAAPSAEAYCGSAPFGNTTATLTGALAQTVPGAKVGYTLALQGEGRMPESTVAVEVRSPDNRIIERFMSSEQLENNSAAFVLRVPGRIAQGAYVVTARAVPADIPYPDIFSAPLPQGSAELTVVDETEGSVGFSSEHIAQSGPSHLSVIAVNDSNEPYKGMITWRVFAEDASLNDGPVLEHTEPLELHPHTSKSADYVVPSSSQGAFYIEARTTDGRFASLADTWLIDGSISNAVPCDNAMSYSYSQMWQALALIAVVIGGGIFWSKWKGRRRGGL